MTGKVTKENIREALAAKGFGGQILFHGRVLGRFVTHGHRSGNGKTVYTSRISTPFLIEVEAASKQSMLNKIAAALAKGIKASKIEINTIGKLADNNYDLPQDNVSGNEDNVRTSHKDQPPSQ